MENSTTTPEWYDKSWLVILLCILFFPVGLYALWKNSSITKNWKIIITVIIALIVVINMGNKDKKNSKKITTETQSTENEIKTDGATKLKEETEKSKSIEFAKEQLVELTDEEFSNLQKGNLNKIILSQKTLNDDLIALMKKHAPERRQIIEKIEAKKEQEKITAELEAKRKKQEELNKNRKETIDKQFSSWDGSHPALTKLIKESMNDPDSYEHIDTKFRDDGNSIFVITKFRGTNAFGAKVINTVSAKVDFEGNVIKVMSSK